MLSWMSTVRGGKWLLPLAAGWLVALIPAGAAPAEPLGPLAGPRIALAGAAQVWATHLPLQYTQSIRSVHLVGATLYALGNDGTVLAVRADTGEHVWTRRLAEPFQTLWPPVPGRHAGSPAVVFTRLAEAVFLDPRTGRELARVPLGDTTTASVAVSDDHVFAVAPQNRARCLRLADGFRSWVIAMPAPIHTAPVYRADGDAMVVVCDAGGRIAALDSSKKKYFMRSLESVPAGPVAMDHLAIYVVTDDSVLHAIERATGDLVWRYRLVDRADGGPDLTPTGLYQATRGGGLYRFDLAAAAAAATQPASGRVIEDAAAVGAVIPRRLEPPDETEEEEENGPAPVIHDRPRIDAEDRALRCWYVPTGRQFLAEWPARIALLRTDGRIALIPRGSRTGDAAELLDVGPVDGAVSNPCNDAIFLTSPRGTIRCLRPLRATPLTLADFGVEPAAPTTPAAGPPAGVAAEQASTAPEAATPPPVENEQDRLLNDPLRSRIRIAP